MPHTLLTLNPDAIVDFCRRHPVDLMPAYRREVVRGGAGDVETPTPAVDAFFTLWLTILRGELPTQQRYAEYCHEIWADWFTSHVSRYVDLCITARLYRCFYVSCLDSIHLWALLGTRFYADGHLVFDRCVIDTQADVTMDADLLVYRGEECLRIAHYADTYEARQARQYKQAYRHARRAIPKLPTIDLPLPIHPNNRIGGKCWFQWPHHFIRVFRKVAQLWLPGLEPL